MTDHDAVGRGRRELSAGATGFESVVAIISQLTVRWIVLVADQPTVPSWPVTVQLSLLNPRKR